MDTTTGPILESRAARRIWIVPLGILGMTLLLPIAWVLLNLTGSVDGLEFVGLVMLAIGIFSLGVAVLWAWGLRRARLVIARDELVMVPILGRTQSLSVSRLDTVRLGQVSRSGTSEPTLDLSDADGGRIQIGSKGWEREADILRAIGDAAERSGAAVSPDARDAIARGSIGTSG